MSAPDLRAAPDKDSRRGRTVAFFHAGSTLKGNLMFCEGCGCPLNDAASFCSSCGQSRAASLAGRIAQQSVGAVSPSQGTATITPVDQFPTPQSAGSGFSTAGIILGAIAFLFFPIFLGPAGLILGAVGKSKGEEKAVVAMTVAACGTVIGMIIGAILGASTL